MTLAAGREGGANQIEYVRCLREEVRRALYENSIRMSGPRGSNASIDVGRFGCRLSAEPIRVVVAGLG